MLVVLLVSMTWCRVFMFSSKFLAPSRLNGRAAAPPLDLSTSRSFRQFNSCPLMPLDIFRFSLATASQSPFSSLELGPSTALTLLNVNRASAVPARWPVPSNPPYLPTLDGFKTLILARIQQITSIVLQVATSVEPPPITPAPLRRSTVRHRPAQRLALTGPEIQILPSGGWGVDGRKGDSGAAVGGAVDQERFRIGLILDFAKVDGGVGVVEGIGRECASGEDAAGCGQWEGSGVLAGIEGRGRGEGEGGGKGKEGGEFHHCWCQR
jgi:hypothetical protein